MEYFAGLDVSMSETHVCVVTQDGAVIHEQFVVERRPVGHFEIADKRKRGLDAFQLDEFE